MIILSFLIITLACTLLGFITGIMGCISYIKKQTLLADAVAHATLPGIALAFLIVPNASIPSLIIGGTITGLLGALLVSHLSNKLPLKKDAIIGTILAVFLGIGLVAMTCIQKTSNARQACLNKFLYGNASLMLLDDLYFIAAISAILLISIVIMLPTYKARLFDTSFAEVTAIASSRFDTLFTLLYVSIIATGIQTVGIILISSMLICPILISSNHYQSFTTQCYISGLIGGVSAALGSCLSYYFILPPGPCITLTQGSIAFIVIIARTYYTREAHAIVR